MNPRFRITVGSDLEHEDLVGNLYYDDTIVCVLTQEQGPGMWQIEFFGPPGGGVWGFTTADFDAAVDALKRRMRELVRIESD